MKLSNEEIAKVFAMYLGCNCIGYPYFKNSDEKTHHQVNGKITGVLDDSVRVLYRDVQGYNWDAHSHEVFEDVKLLLTPLSEITDEHAVGVAKVLGVLYEKEPFGSDKHFDKVGLIQFIQEIFCDIFNYVVPVRVVALFQYLISKGYAVSLWFGIDHWANGKTPLDLGIAISKNEVK